MENKNPSLDEALSKLQEEGYTADLSFETNTVALYGSELDLRSDPEEFRVDEIEWVGAEAGVVVEGDGDDARPDADADGEKAVHATMIMAISSSTGVKGVIIENK